MTDNGQGRQRRRRQLRLAGIVLVVLLAGLLVPPMVSISRYKSQITQLISTSLGRPVRLASVNLRLLPWPGFVLSDLTVEEDPAYGAEPVLHASSVTASIRLLSLWRGRLAISSISVDEASLNLVHTGPGLWNLDPIFRTAAAHAGQAGGARHAVALPYLEATHSRINIKNGAEKLPFSLEDTDLSFWQDSSGQWRIRLRGQPVRTDMSIDSGDTGEVRLEAAVRSAPALRQMPLHLELEWRQAQLGQLTRLLIGSDPGWRGDLTADFHLDGTADAAQIKARLRATGVHRAEFAPAAPLDFDANCGFVYHYNHRSLENLACDSPLGTGHVRLAGELPGAGGASRLSVELDHIPVTAGLDALRTLRSTIEPDLVAHGTVSGKITYARSPEKNAGVESAAKPAKMRSARAGSVVPAPLTGSLTVEGFQLSGSGLSQPVQAAKIVIEPAASAHPLALAGSLALPAGGDAPLTVSFQLGLYHYQFTARGQASVARARELAHAAGIPEASVLDALAGDPLSIDLTAAGPWLPAANQPLAVSPHAAAPGAPVPGAGGDTLTGTVTLHNANWKAEFLANHVLLSEATLHLGDGATRWDPIVFSYGPVKGTASLTLAGPCDLRESCPDQFHVQFGALDAGTLQAAILGAQEHDATLLAALIARLRPAAPPVWPPLEGTVAADALTLGPLTLRQPVLNVRIAPNQAEITSLQASALGGQLQATGSVNWSGNSNGKPSYAFQGRFDKLNAAAVGQLLGQRWSGGAFAASGKVALTGYTGADLAQSAQGTLHFDWRHGAISAAGATVARKAAQPVRFERWTGDAAIANGGIQLQQNQVLQAGRKRALDASLTFGDPPKVSLAVPARPSTH